LRKLAAREAQGKKRLLYKSYDALIMLDEIFGFCLELPAGMKSAILVFLHRHY
jgi:hypothetical protein